MYLFPKANAFAYRIMACTLLLLLSSATAACIRTPVGRDVSVVSARWEPDQTLLTIVDNLDLLNEEEKAALLQEPTVHGRITAFRYSSTGRGTGSRIVLVLQKPVEDRVYLPVPQDEAENCWAV
jgi:hypothetical protein